MANIDQAEPVPPELAEGPIVQIDDRYRILLGSRVPELDLDGAEAVVAHDDHHSDEAVFARVCAPHSLPRVELMNSLRNMKDAAVMRPLTWGPVPMPGKERPRLAVVFNRPESDPLMAASAISMKPIPSEDVSRLILAPAVLALGYLSQRGMTHRAIRPSNIYWTGPARDTIMLGDCVTNGPAVNQPIIFETISSAMTPPVGRGDGLTSDDFYALGVSLLIIITGQCALFRASNAEVIESKVSRGSYAALMGDTRMTFGMRDVLHGLLADDVVNRWGLTELEQWLIGGTRNKVQENKRVGVARAFEFEGKEFTNCRALAHAFTLHPKAGAKAGSNPEFAKWLLRNIADESISDQIGAIARSASTSGSNSGLNPRQLARVCAALDKNGPIRYKTLIAKAPALGNVLADGFMRKDKAIISLVGETIGNGLATDWYTAQSNQLQLRYEKQMMNLKAMQTSLSNNGIGHGIERCLYSLSPSFACFSEVLEDHFITDVRDLLPALEEIVSRKGKLLKLVDRHLAAFIAARGKINLDRRFATIEAAKGDVNLIKLGMLGILATLQHKYGPSQLPALTDWMAGELEPAINRFGSKSTRDELLQRLGKAGSGGRLIELNSCLNNEKSLRIDEIAQKKATREFIVAGREIDQLQSKAFQDTVQELGWRIATGISASVAGASVIILAMS
ncbi:MAG: hypothetical protein V3R85_08190 [Alphaproteobacteria bacterium]